MKRAPIASQAAGAAVLKAAPGAAPSPGGPGSRSATIPAPVRRHAPDALADLEYVAAVAEQHDDPRCTGFADAVRAYVQGAGATSLDDMLGLRASGWWRVAARQRRLDALIRLARRTCPDAKPNAAAKALCALLTRYVTTATWRQFDRHRAVDDPPADEQRRDLWLIARKGVPSSTTIRKMLAANCLSK